MNAKIQEVTLRDLFAAFAMQARIIAIGNHYHKSEAEVLQCQAETATRAYQHADWMLKQRKAKQRP